MPAAKPEHRTNWTLLGILSIVAITALMRPDLIEGKSREGGPSIKFEKKRE